MTNINWTVPEHLKASSFLYLVAQERGRDKWNPVLIGLSLTLPKTKKLQQTQASNDRYTTQQHGERRCDSAGEVHVTNKKHPKVRDLSNRVKNTHRNSTMAILHQHNSSFQGWEKGFRNIHLLRALSSVAVSSALGQWDDDGNTRLSSNF